MHRILIILLSFAGLYLFLIGFVHTTCRRDPTSAFFQGNEAHRPIYSTQRIKESVEYADISGILDTPTHSRTPPKLCVGVASVSRNGSSYLKSTLGSMQQGLTEAERESLYFVVLLGHTDQSRHPDHNQKWLTNMADKLLSYDQDPELRATAEEMEGKKSHWLKSKFDYAFVLDECKKTGAPYILMLEDDVVFLDGWRHRTMQALDSTAAASAKSKETILYLRLFYYEGLRGWNVETWPKYLRMAMLAEALALVLLYGLRRFTSMGRRHVSGPDVWIVCGVFVPLFIGLVFAAGGNCVRPLSRGVEVVTRNICCGQGLVFPSSSVDQLLATFYEKRWELIATDSLIEEYGDRTGYLRWTLTPVVMQHVGGHSSYGEIAQNSLSPSDTWNFAFEQNDATKLAKEHEQNRDVGLL